MRVEVVHIGGHYAKRVVDTLKQKAPDKVFAYQVTSQLPLMVDDAAEFLPPELGQAEIIIAINLHQDLLLEIPHAVRGKATRAIIAPIEDPSWIRPGLQRQVTGICAEFGIETAFPKPFCALEAASPAIREFCDSYHFGKPEFRITLEDGRIKKIVLLKGAVCGLTEHLILELEGQPAVIDDIVHDTMYFHHGYPCLATMALDEDGETLMHHSVFMLRDAIKKALEEAEKASTEGKETHNE